MKYQLARGFPPLSERRASLQSDPSCLEYNETHSCSLVAKSRVYPERNLVSMLFLMRIDSIPSQRSRDVSSPETSIEALLKLSKRKVCERLRTPFDSQGRLMCHRVNNEHQCIVVNTHFCQHIHHLICCSHVFYQHRMIQIHSLKKSKSTLCDLVTCLRFWASSFVDHLDHCRIVCQ